MGDIIYSLPTIRAFGGGVLHISIRMDTRERLTPRLYQPLVPLLLRATDYVVDVCPWQAESVSETSVKDLDRFRDHIAPGRNIADSHLLAWGLDTSHRDRSWLTVSDPLQIATVVFHRSERSRNAAFPWGKIYSEYGAQAVFVGWPYEHAMFCREVGKVPYLPTADFYELARVIAGCKLYVGNQSAPLAVAEGLKVRLIAEHPPGDAARCRFQRPGAGFDVTEETVLPELNNYD